jgi:hypothetical protein
MIKTLLTLDYVRTELESWRRRDRVSGATA